VIPSPLLIAELGLTIVRSQHLEKIMNFVIVELLFPVILYQACSKNNNGIVFHVFMESSYFLSKRCTVKKKRRIINPHFTFMAVKSVYEPGVPFHKPFFLEKVGKGS
jgi:hypothetical protein